MVDSSPGGGGSSSGSGGGGGSGSNGIGAAVNGTFSSSAPSRALCVALQATSARHLAVGTQRGFLVYSIEPLRLLHSEEIAGGVQLLEILPDDEQLMLALVGTGLPHSFSDQHVLFWDCASRESFSALKHQRRVRAIRVLASHCAVAMDHELVVYSMNIKMLCLEGGANAYGALALSAKLVAFPGRKSGSVAICALEHDATSIEVAMFDGPVQTLQIDAQSTLIAAAAPCGRRIWLYDYGRSQITRRFVRGLLPSTIHCMSFSCDGLMLATAGSSGTVHVFSLAEKLGAKEQRSAIKLHSPFSRDATTPELLFHPQQCNLLIATATDSTLVKFELDPHEKSCLSRTSLSYEPSGPGAVGRAN